MPQVIERLTKKFIETQVRRGNYADGLGLYLNVSKGGTKTWVFRFSSPDKPGRSHWMGLGSIHDMSITEARQTAGELRRQVRREGINPIAVRKQGRQDARTTSGGAVANEHGTKIKTFSQYADEYIEKKSKGWSNSKHQWQWRQSLDAHVVPQIGSKPVAAITAQMIANLLDGDQTNSLWQSRPETARRVRARIEGIIAYAFAVEDIRGDNPASWTRLKPMLSDQRTQVEHHAALPWKELPGFMVQLSDTGGVAALALMFTILTAARTGETIGATWSEIDAARKVWVIPASRMKARREHRVPLTDAAIKLLERVKPAAMRGNPTPKFDAPVFPGLRAGTHLSNMSMMAVLKRMKRSDLTVHGMRSTFRDWVAEGTDFDGDVAEAALAHVISDSTRAAYERGDKFDKRAVMMAAWARYCASGSAPANDATDGRSMETADQQVAA